MNEQDNERLLGEALEALRTEPVDPGLTAEAAERAWARVAAEAQSADAQQGWNQIGSRAPRRIFSVAPTAADAAAASYRSVPQRLFGSRSARFALAAAAAVTLALGLTAFAGRLTIGGTVGQVHAMDGSLVLLAGSQMQALATGEALDSGSAVRTGAGANAVLVLPDGTRLEMDERSELRIDRTLRGPSVRVTRGRVFVTGGSDGAARLLTPDGAVLEGGAAYAVNRGVLGTRITVLEGEVDLDGPDGSLRLGAGDQFTSGDRLQAAPFGPEIAWSRDAELYGDIVASVEAAQVAVKQALSGAPVRAPNGMPDRAPAGTVVYAAFPNVADAVLDAQVEIFHSLRQNPHVAAEMAADGPEATAQMQELEDMLASIKAAATHLGDEIVVAWVIPEAPAPGAAFGDLVPVILATVPDETAVRSGMTAVMAEMNDLAETPVVRWLDSSTDAELVMHMDGGILTASPDAALVAQVAAGAGGLEQEFRAVVDGAYARGVTWLGVVDLARMTALSAADSTPDELAMMERTGFLDATHLVVEQRGDEGRAVLSFAGPRRGMAGWLAEPAPVGALAFVSGEASIAGAFASRDGVEMFDDFLGLLGLSGPEAANEFTLLEEEIGISLRDDLAASVGGEVAFALDGAVLPEPAWKLVLEVVDPVRMQSTLAAIAAKAAADGEDIVLESVESGARIDYRIVVDGKERAVYTYADGYLVAAPRADLVERSLRYRADGFTLERAAAFRALLPTDARPNFSALWYQNLGPVLEPLSQARELAGEDIPVEAMTMLAESMEPSLAVAYAEPDGITVASRGGMGPFGLDVVGMLGSAQAMSLHGALGAPGR